MVDPQAKVNVSSLNEREVYVGPRPFERSEQNLFFGRDREISELLSLVTSNRVVLCYAPSGAGKTSLINAGLQPRLEKEGFEVLPSTRVRGLIPEGVDQTSVANIYIFNAVLSLAKETGIPAELARCTLAEFLSTVPHQTDEEDFPSPRILIFDQFEELLTSYLERWQEREGFFHQVHDALQEDPLLRVLLVMREDYVARIEPFMRILKPLQQTRFRLDLLGPSGAQSAVTGPLRGTHRRFKDGVVETLIEELLKVRVEAAHGEATEVIGEYVEPVQLQVVCRNLWTSLPDDVQEISHEHLKAYGDVDQALRDFYESCLASAKTDLRTNEADLRQWFERQLITPAGTRGIVFRDAKQTAGLANSVVDFLENKHIIRGEWRAGSRWYELTHDRLIEPIQRANERWRAQRQARRNRIFSFAGATLVLALMLFAIAFSFQRGTAAVPADSTVVAAATSANENATLAGDAQSTTVAILSTSVAVQADASISKSRQLAAEALLANDRNLSLLLAIEANRSDDTLEARRSLHKVLSQQSYVDGTFLRELHSDVIAPALLGRFTDHQGSVVSVAFGPDANRFVSGGGNGTLLVWDTANMAAIGPSLTTNRSSIESVAYSPDGRLLASTGQDLEITLWDANTGERFGDPLVAHEELVTCLAFSPDGKLLASGSMDRQIVIWDVENGVPVDFLKAVDTVASLAWSPNGLVLAAGTFGPTVSFWETDSNGIWNLNDELSGFSNPVRSAAWSPDGKLLALGLGSDDNAPPSGDVIIWDYENRQEFRYPIADALQPFKTTAFGSAGEIPSTGQPEGSIVDNTQRVRSVAFHPAGKILAIGRDDGTIVFLDVQSGQIIGTPLKAHNHWVMSIDFSPDGRYLLSGSLDRTLALWSLLTAASTLAVSPTGEFLAASQGPIISLWDLSAREIEPARILSEHTDVVLALTFSPDGKTLVSSGRDNLMLFWNTETGEQLDVAIRTLSNVRTLQFSPNGTTLAAGGDSGRAQLSNPLTGQVLHQLVELSRPVLKVQFSQDGGTLDVIGSDGSLTTFDLQTPRPGKIAESALPSAQDGIMSVAISPDATKAAYVTVGETAVLSNDERAHGILIGSWDQSFDPTVNPTEIDFVVIKATEGTQFVDPTFEEYVKSIQTIPMRGAFHYFRKDQPWKEQADHFLSKVQDKGFHFYFLDMEVQSQDGGTEFPPDAEQWLRYVEEQVDGSVMLAASSQHLSEFGSSAEWMKNWPLLVIQYDFKPDRNGNPALPEGFSEWMLWNYTDQGSGREYGVGRSSVFLVVYNGTPLEMAQWLGISSFSILDRASGAVAYPKQAIQVSAPNGMAFSPDGTYLAVAGPGSVTLLNTASNETSTTISAEEVSTLTVSGRSVISLAFLPDGSTLVIGTDDGAILLWDLSLLSLSADKQSMIDVACSHVRQNFTEAEWGQYVSGNSERQTTCPNAPLP